MYKNCREQTCTSNQPTIMGSLKIIYVRNSSLTFIYQRIMKVKHAMPCQLVYISEGVNFKLIIKLAKDKAEVAWYVICDTDKDESDLLVKSCVTVQEVLSTRTI